MNTANELMNLKEEIEDAEKELQDAETREAIIIEQLETDFQVNTIDEAKALMNKLSKKENTLERKIETLIAEITNVFSD